MAKKKNTSKKHKFKHAEPALATTAPNAEQSAPVVAQGIRERTNQPIGVVGRDLSYVNGELRRVGVFAGALVALEGVLFYLLVHTPIGSQVYSLVKV